MLIELAGRELYAVSVPSFSRQAFGNTFYLDEPGRAPKIWNKQVVCKYDLHDLCMGVPKPNVNRSKNPT